MAQDKSVKTRRLIVFPGALGDLICAAPALARLAQRRAGVWELMARAELARFAVGRIAGVERDHSIDRREVAELFRNVAGAKARAFFSQFEEIVSFFAANDEQFRRGLAAAAPGAALSFHRFRPEGTGHVALGYLREVGADLPLGPALTVLESDLAAARSTLESLGLREGHYVVLFPGSGSAAKNWPAPKFAQLATQVASKFEALVVLGPAEEGLEPQFRGRGIRCIGGLDLGALAGIARLAAGFVGNDSGVSHLAGAAGARGVALFGPTDPARWRPSGEVSVIHKEPMDAIGVDEVVVELDRVVVRRIPSAVCSSD